MIFAGHLPKFAISFRFRRQFSQFCINHCWKRMFLHLCRLLSSIPFAPPPPSKWQFKISTPQWRNIAFCANRTSIRLCPHAPRILRWDSFVSRVEFVRDFREISCSHLPGNWRTKISKIFNLPNFRHNFRPRRGVLYSERDPETPTDKKIKRGPKFNN